MIDNSIRPGKSRSVPLPDDPLGRALRLAAAQADDNAVKRWLTALARRSESAEGGGRPPDHDDAPGADGGRGVVG